MDEDALLNALVRAARRNPERRKFVGYFASDGRSGSVRHPGLDEPLECGIESLDELDSRERILITRRGQNTISRHGARSRESLAAGKHDPSDTDTADVQLFDRLGELQAVALAGGTDTLGLLGRGDKPLAVTVADARHAHDPDGPTIGGSRGC